MEFTTTFLDRLYRTYNLICMIISIDQRLTAPTIRVAGSAATHLQYF